MRHTKCPKLVCAAIYGKKLRQYTQTAIRIGNFISFLSERIYKLINVFDKVLSTD